MSRPVDYAALTERRCSKCRVTKPVDQFTRYDDPKAVLTGWRYHSRCRPCSNEDSRAYGADNRSRRNERLRRWRRNNPEAALAKDRRARLRTKYGLSEADVEALLAVHDGNCWLCLARPAVAIDHDHQTGRVRGVTCHGCNSVVLSRVDNDPDFLDRVVAYVAIGHADELIRARVAAADAAGEVCHGDVILRVAAGGEP